MKKIITMLCFVLAGTYSFAQFEWLGIGYAVTKYVHTQDKGHIVIRDDGYFTSIDSFGISNYGFPDANATDTVKVFDVLELLDSSYVYFYSALSPSAMVEFYHGVRINNAWEELSLTQIGCEVTCSESASTVPFDNNSMIKCDRYTSSDSKIARISVLDGHAIWQLIFDGNIFYDLAVLGDNFYICTNEGLWKFDGDGNITAQFPNQVFDRILSIDNNTFLVQKADTLIQFSQDLDLLDTIIISNGQVEDIDVRFGKIGVLTTTDHYFVFDEAFNELSNFQLNNSNYEYGHTQIGSDGIFLAGIYFYGPSIWPTGGPFIKEYGIDGIDHTIQKDMGVDNLSHTQQESVFQQGGSYFVQYDSLLVTLTNFGDTSINKLVLKSGYYPSSGNFHYGNHKNINNINPPIEPGESRTFVWEGLTLSFDEDPAGNIINFCIITTLPNGGFDVDSTNDMGCASFLVDTKIVIQIPTHINVFPNPATTHVNLSRETPSADKSVVSLVDQMGRVVRQQTLPVGWQTESLETNGLANGLYFWQLVEEGRQVGAGKLVVQR